MAGSGAGVRNDLAELIDLLRAKGVISYEGPVDESQARHCKLLFGPPPAPKPKKGDTDPRATKRSHYENLLGRPHSDEELDLLP